MPRERGRPLRGPGHEQEGGFAAHLSAAAAFQAGGRAARGYGGKHGQALACPARGAARPVRPCPPHRRTPGTGDELAFDSQKRKRNHKNPLTGSVHTSRGLPPHLLAARLAVLVRGGGAAMLGSA